MRLAVWLRAAAVLGLGAATSAPLGAQETGGLPDFSDSEIRVLGSPVDPNVRKATALVNGDVITDTDVEHRLALVLLANRGATIPDEERARLRLQVLRNLIDEKIQISKARAEEITVPEEEVTRAFERVARNFKQTPEQLSRYLASNGSSDATLKQQIRAELYWSRLLRRTVEPMVNVGDDEVNAVIAKLEANKGQDEYRVGEIFLAATPELMSDALAGAAKITEAVRKGASFVAYARQFSEASTAAVGGDLGWLQLAQLSAPMQEQVRKLSRGQVSDPFPVPGGVAIVALVDQRKVLAADPDNAILSLKQLTLKIPAGTAEVRARDMVKDFQKRTLAMGGCGGAEKVGKDIGAEVINNDEVPLRALPPQLQTIMRQLQIGEVTPPFGSAREGIRVLALCGRDDPKVANEPDFNQVYAQMNEERVNMMARRYLRDLRRDAIIDYR